MKTKEVPTIVKHCLGCKNCWATMQLYTQMLILSQYTAEMYSKN